MKIGTKTCWCLCLAALGTMSSEAVLSETQKPAKSWMPFFANSGQWQGKPHIDIFGVFQPTFTHSNTNGGAIEDNFSFTRARLGVRGTATESISYFTLYELARNGVTAPTNGGARLLDARINWAFSDYANLSMGQFIPDFAKAIQPGATVNWIDYTDVEKSVWFFNRQGDTQTTALRELGASLWNEFRWGNSAFNYEVGMYNGAGLQQVEQTDDDKDFVMSARFAHGPWWVHSGYWTGDRKISGEKFGKDKYSVTAGWGNNITAKYWVFGEYLKTKEEQPGNLSDVESDGYYVAAGWRPKKKIGLAYRYSTCDCEDNIGPPGKRDSMVHTFTATYYIKGQMKILAQYDARSDDRSSAPEGDTFRVYFSLPFSYRLLK